MLYLMFITRTVAGQRNAIKSFMTDDQLFTRSLYMNNNLCVMEKEFKLKQTRAVDIKNEENAENEKRGIRKYLSHFCLIYILVLMLCFTPSLSYTVCCSVVYL